MGDEIIDTVRDRFRTRQRHIREIREMAENHDQLARAFNGKRLGPRGTSLSKFKKTYLVYTILASHRPLSDSLHHDHRAKALQTERQTDRQNLSRVAIVQSKNNSVFNFKCDIVYHPLWPLLLLLRWSSPSLGRRWEKWQHTPRWHCGESPLQLCVIVLQYGPGHAAKIQGKKIAFKTFHLVMGE